MEMIIAGVIKEARYTFHNNDHIYSFNFNLKGSIGLISNGHVSLSSTTSTFSITDWDTFESFMSNLFSTEDFASEVSKFEESLTKQNKLQYWDEYLNLRINMIRELLDVLPCQFQASFPCCLAHKVNPSGLQPLPLETDIDTIKRATAVLLALNALPSEAQSLAAYSNVVDVEYFERLLEKSRRRKEIYGDIIVDI
jgi:GH15 family glucan-1,4-alpha-glucosidase